MQISLQQYNAVVTGLRTQLELHRAKESEQRDTIHQLVSQVDRLNKESELMLKATEEVCQQRDRLIRQLTACGQIAQGDFTPLSSGEHCNCDAALKVSDLRSAYEAKLVAMVSKARQRKKRK